MRLVILVSFPCCMEGKVWNAVQVTLSFSCRSAHTLELARTLLELPQPRSPARSSSYHTPSPKPSPGTLVAKSKSPGKKKMSSSSPGEREGFYPCNRCGRWVAFPGGVHSALLISRICKQSESKQLLPW